MSFRDLIFITSRLIFFVNLAEIMQIMLVFVIMLYFRYINFWSQIDKIVLWMHNNEFKNMAVWDFTYMGLQ